MISVLIADDQALVRGGLRMIIDAQQDMHVIGEAENGAEAVASSEGARAPTMRWQLSGLIAAKSSSVVIPARHNSSISPRLSGSLG